MLQCVSARVRARDKYHTAKCSTGMKIHTVHTGHRRVSVCVCVRFKCNYTCGDIVLYLKIYCCSGDTGPRGDILLVLTE